MLVLNLNSRQNLLIIYYETNKPFHKKIIKFSPRLIFSHVINWITYLYETDVKNNNIENS